MTGLNFQNTRQLHRRHNNVKRQAAAGASGLGSVAPPGPTGSAPNSVPPSKTPPQPTGNNQPSNPTPTPKSNPPPNQNPNPDPNQNQSSSSNPASSTQSPPSASSTPSSAAPSASVPVVPPPTNAILVSRTGLPVPTNNVPSYSFGTAASNTALPTSTPIATPTSALSTGAIVGVAAGGLVALGVLISLIMWIVRRYFQGRRERDEDDDDAYMRNSVHVEDEPNYFNQPRPPTMIERHFGSAGVGAHGAVSFNPGEVAPPAVNPFMTPMGSPSVSQHDMVNYDPQQQQRLQQQQQPYVTRKGSVESKYSHEEAQAPRVEQEYYHQDMQPPHQEGGSYADLERSSVTPYQAQQYAAIRHQLGNGERGNNEDGPARALSPDNGFGGAAPVNYPVPGHMSNFSHPSRNLGSIPETGQQQYQIRPTTVYDEEDAYGGI